LWHLARLMLNLQRSIGINMVEFSLNSASIYWNSIVFDRNICCFFLNNTSEVHKELLVRCPETIQHICMSILVLNKTIIFAWPTKIMQILGARPKVFGFGNHVRSKRLGLATTLSPIVHAKPKRHRSRTMSDPSTMGRRNHARPKQLGFGNHSKPKHPCQTQVPWV
jgi:hypothetical protein